MPTEAPADGSGRFRLRRLGRLKARAIGPALQILDHLLMARTTGLRSPGFFGQLARQSDYVLCHGHSPLLTACIGSHRKSTHNLLFLLHNSTNLMAKSGFTEPAANDNVE